MAEGEPIGGFFASLRLDADDDSFAKGERALSSLATAVKAFIGYEAIKGFAEFVTKINSAEAAMNDLAYATGINTDELNRWQAVMKILGQDSNDFVGHLRDLKNLSADLRAGVPLAQQKVRDMSLLGLSERDWMDADPSALAAKIIDAAERQTRAHPEMRDTIYNEMERLLGRGGGVAVSRGLAQGKSAEEWLSEAAQLIVTTEKERQAAEKPAQDINKFGVMFSELQAKFSMGFMRGLDPGMQKALDFSEANRTRLGVMAATGGEKLGELVAQIAADVAKIADAFGMLGQKTPEEQVKQTADLFEKHPLVMALNRADLWLTGLLPFLSSPEQKKTDAADRQTFAKAIELINKANTLTLDMTPEARRFFSINKGTDRLSTATERRATQ